MATQPDRFARGERVSISLRGKTIAATVTDRSLSGRGLFYVTRDDAGVERKVRSAHVSAVSSESGPDIPDAVGSLPDTARTDTGRLPDPTPQPGAKTRPPLPDWPRGMPAWLAAAYIGVSEPVFRRLVKPVRLTPGRVVWLREDLDAHLDHAAGKDVLKPQNEWLDYFK